MNREKLQTSFFIGLLALILVLSLFILLPYLTILVLAVVLAITFEPLYRTLRVNILKNQSLAALATILVVVIAVLTPLTIFGVMVFKEAGGLYASVTENDRGLAFVTHLTESIDQKLKLVNRGFAIDVNALLKQMLGWVVGNAGAIFSGIAQSVFGLLLTMLAFYYFLKDGSRLRDALMRLSPLDDAYDALIVEKLKNAVHSVVLGTLTVAIIQGLLVSIGFYLFGVPNGALWGAVAAVTALIPFVGTTIVLLPAIAYLFIFGSTASWVGLLIWGALAVGLIDNFLTPKLIGRGTQIHPLLILFSVLGGFSFFGPAGFLIGPLTISLLFALFDIYRKIFANQQEARSL